MATQVQNGKAFEWAIAVALSDLLGVEIFEDDASEKARKCYLEISSTLRTRFIEAALLSTEHIAGKEAEHPAITTPLIIQIASDSRGQQGDVRDVVITAESGIELGISCKSNHEAFKHPRVSDSLDFINSWGISSSGCSPEYWNQVKPLFLELRKIRKESNQQEIWQNIEDYQVKYYLPVLNAFSKELWNFTSPSSSNAAVATKGLVSFLIGQTDFYKVICTQHGVQIQGFNFGNTLHVPKTHMPRCVIAIDEFDGGPYSKTIRLDKGMTFNFRIHLASKRVEPSLKFDVQAVSLPASEIYTNHISMN